MSVLPNHDLCLLSNSYRGFVRVRGVASPRLRTSTLLALTLVIILVCVDQEGLQAAGAEEPS